MNMMQMSDIRQFTADRFHFLMDCGFTACDTTNNLGIDVVCFAGEMLGIEIELDWRECSAFVLLVKLVNGKRPAGYYVNAGNVVRIHLIQFLRHLAVSPGLDIDGSLKRLKRTKERVDCSTRIANDVDAYAELLESVLGLLPFDGNIVA